MRELLNEPASRLESSDTLTAVSLGVCVCVCVCVCNNILQLDYILNAHLKGPSLYIIIPIIFSLKIIFRCKLTPGRC